MRLERIAEAELAAALEQLDEETSAMDLESARAHYIAAMANWNLALDHRDQLLAELAVLRPIVETVNAWVDEEGSCSFCGGGPSFHADDCALAAYREHAAKKHASTKGSDDA